MDKIETAEQFDEWAAKNPDKSIVLFKRSTRCPTSFIAFENFRRFAEAHPEVPCAYVNVIEDRPASNYVAAATGVEHQSPQVLLLKNKKALWNTSHHNITEEGLILRCTKE